MARRGGSSRRGGRKADPSTALPLTGVVLVAGEASAGATIIERWLTAKGYTVTTVADVLGLLRAIDAGGGAVIVDHTDADAQVATTSLRAVRSAGDPAVAAIPILVCVTGPAAVADLWAEGADSCLVRPFHIDQVVDELNRLTASTVDERAAGRKRALARCESDGPLASAVRWVPPGAR